MSKDLYLKWQEAVIASSNAWDEVAGNKRVLQYSIQRAKATDKAATASYTEWEKNNEVSPNNGE